MDAKLYLALINCFRGHRSGGFTFPIALAIGLILTLIGTVMVVRSNSDRVDAAIQQSASQALSIAETGIAQVLSNLNAPSQRFFIALNFDALNPATGKAYLGPDGDPATNDGETTVVDEWTNPPLGFPPCVQLSQLLSNARAPGSVTVTNPDGSYRLLAYRVRKIDPDSVPSSGDEYDRGYLLLEGTKSGLANPSNSRLLLTFVLAASTVPGTIPGLYGSEEVDMGNNDVLVLRGSGSGENSANVVCKDCEITDPNDCQAGQPTRQGAEASINLGQNGDVAGDILLGDPNLPDVPAMVVDVNYGGSITGTETLPRAMDSDTDGNNKIVYVVDSINLGDGQTLTVNTRPDQKIEIFVTGDINFSGSAQLIHDDSSTGTPDDGKLMNFAIFGNPEDPNDTQTDRTFCFLGNGGTLGEVFVYGPDAHLGIVGGGSGGSNVTGAMWGKSWGTGCGSSSNVAALEVPNDLATSLEGYFPNLDIGIRANSTGIATSWERKEVN